MTAVGFRRVTALKYLEAVYLGKPGYLQICSYGNWVGRFFRTDAHGLADAVNYAADLDSRGTQGVYHRVTTLRDIPPAGERGGAEDTFWMPGIWGDVDFGQAGHKKANTLPPDADAAQKAIVDSGAPKPTLLIHSGGGLYPLHLLGQGIYVDCPERLVQLERFAVQVQDVYLYGSLVNGWSYGTGVSDLARVIRLVGSVNRKTDVPRPCRIIGGTGLPVAMTDFPKPDRERMTALARELVKTDPTAQIAQPLPEKRAWTGGTGTRGVLDVIADLDWDEILVPAGWEQVGADTNGDLWMRPGGDSSSKYSARILHAEPNVLVVHSESTELPAGGGQRLTKARVYSYLAGHGGDMSATAIALINHEDPLGLPASVFDEIDAVMAERNSWFGLAPTIVTLPAQPQTEAVRTTDTLPEAAATDEEMRYFLTTYTRYTRPPRLSKRVTWAKQDPAVSQGRHFRALIEDAIAGYYPAEHALRAMVEVHRHHQGTATARTLLSLALGAVLNAKVSA